MFAMQAKRRELMTQLEQLLPALNVRDYLLFINENKYFSIC